MPLKHLTVIHHKGTWYGQEVTWKRSGSGSYREVSGIEIPQDPAAIESFAQEFGYHIEWKGVSPPESSSVTNA